MTKFKFFPESWTPDQKILDWAHDLGLSDKQIFEQLERIKDHEFQPMRSCPMRTFRRWIRNSIQYGHVVPTVTREYRRPDKLSKEQLAEDRRKGEENLERLGRMQLVKTIGSKS